MNESFISYSRKDKEFVERIFAALQKTGIDPWMDSDDIPVASRWKQEILVGIQYCHNFLYVISPDSVISEYCDMELDHALALNKRIIPIAKQLCPNIRESISELNWIFFDNFDEGISNLLEILDSPLGTSFGDRLDAQIRISDPLGERTFPLYRNEYRMGRNPQAEFAEAGLFFLGDDATSKRQATLKRREGRWLVVDGEILFNRQGKPETYNPSRNGVIIHRCNSKGKIISRERLRPLQMRPLSHGDIVVFSTNTSFIYEEINPEIGYKKLENDQRDTEAAPES